MPGPKMRIDERLKEWATDRQREIIDAVNKHRSYAGAAQALGVHKSVIRDTVSRCEKKAAIFGYAPQHDLSRPVAPGQRLRGASTLYRRGEAEPVLQWVKSTQDDEQREQIVREAIKAMADECKGLSPIVAGPKHINDDLLAIYPAGDPHWGLRTWAQEAGEDFDLDIAKRLTFAAMDRLVNSAPEAGTALLLPLGDVLHANDSSAQTPKSKHSLDVDGRLQKVIGVTIQAYRHCVLRLLQKHERVIVRFVAGNHDPESVWTLAFTIAAYFDQEPRVTVDLTPSAHWFYRFGKVLIGATHGDKTKPEQLLGVMAADRPEDWGQTKHRYWYTGHIHQQTVREFPGVVCESFRTIAAKDAYAAAYGYRSGRDMKLIVMHREHGEIERHRVDVAMLEPA